MFESMINSIKEGQLLPQNEPSRLFAEAIALKDEQLKLYFGRRSRDENINPDTKHLLWLSFLLEDNKGYRRVFEIIGKEEVQAYAFQRDELGFSKSTRGKIVSSDFIVSWMVEEFLDLAPDENFRELLAKKVKITTFPATYINKIANENNNIGISKEKNKNMDEKRTAVKMVQDVFDELAKEFDENYELKRPLEFLMIELEGLVDLLNSRRIPLDVIEQFCVAFREITPSHLWGYWDSGSSLGLSSEDSEMVYNKWRDTWALLDPYTPKWKIKQFPDINEKCKNWEGIKETSRKWEPDNDPIDRASVWHETMGKHYLRNIYYIKCIEEGNKDKVKQYYIVFEKIQKSMWPQLIHTPEGTPKYILELYETDPYPVIVKKTDQGWEYLIPKTA